MAGGCGDGDHEWVSTHGEADAPLQPSHFCPCTTLQPQIRFWASRLIPSPLSPSQAPGGPVEAYGAEVTSLRTAGQMQALLRRAMALRSTQRTGVNETSSRSHAIIHLVLEPPGGAAVRAGRSNLQGQSSNLERRAPRGARGSSGAMCYVP